MKKLIFIAALFFINPSIFAETKYPDAPLGLKWGMTVEELKSKAGAVLVRPVRSDENVSTYSLKSPPMPVPGITEYYVFVHKDLGAIKFLMAEEINSDTYGTEGKKEYFKYKEALTNKYGEPILYRESVKKDSDEFYLCLMTYKCGDYYSFFGDYIRIELKGLNRKDGYLIIDYESELFIKYIENKENKDKNKIMKAL